MSLTFNSHLLAHLRRSNRTYPTPPYLSTSLHAPTHHTGPPRKPPRRLDAPLALAGVEQAAGGSEYYIVFE
jgi:hypothetical protein